MPGRCAARRGGLASSSTARASSIFGDYETQSRKIEAEKLAIEKKQEELKKLLTQLGDSERILKGLRGQQSYSETNLRSVVKAIGWRIAAGIVTFSSVFYFTKSVKTALKVVGSDFVSKSATMFIGERVWNKVPAGRAAGGDAVSRSVAKALLWRVFAMANTMLVSGFLTGSAKVASQIASVDAVIKTSMMVGYDQMWNSVDWGTRLENVEGGGI